MKEREEKGGPAPNGESRSKNRVYFNHPAPDLRVCVTVCVCLPTTFSNISHNTQGSFSPSWMSLPNDSNWSFLTEPQSHNKHIQEISTFSIHRWSKSQVSSETHKCLWDSLLCQLIQVAASWSFQRTKNMKNCFSVRSKNLLKWFTSCKMLRFWAEYYDSSKTSQTKQS